MGAPRIATALLIAAVALVAAVAGAAALAPPPRGNPPAESIRGAPPSAAAGAVLGTSGGAIVGKTSSFCHHGQCPIFPCYHITETVWSPSHYGYYSTNYADGSPTPDGGYAYYCEPYYAPCYSCYRCQVFRQLTYTRPGFCWVLHHSKQSGKSIARKSLPVPGARVR